MKVKPDGTILQNEFTDEELHDIRILNDLKTRHENIVGFCRAKKVTQGQITTTDALVIFVKEKKNRFLLSRNQIIPPTYNGEVTDVVNCGEITTEDDRSKRARPFNGGMSVGNRELGGYGTAGCVFVRDGKRVLFLNAHVGCEDPRKDVSKQERAILQPGPGHGGKHDNNIIGKLISHIQLQEGVPAYNDAALSSLDPQIVADLEIMDIGDIDGVHDIKVGEYVMKSGATTGVTQNEIKYVDVTARVAYKYEDAEGKVKTYEITHLHCVLTPSMSSAGDSSSVGLIMISEKIYIWGYLFAGSSEYTIWHKIQSVMSAFELTLPIPDDPEPDPELKAITIEITPNNENPDKIDLECTIIDITTKNPVENVLVIVGTPGEGIYTDSDGKALFEDIERKEQVIEVNHENYAAWKDTVMI